MGRFHRLPHLDHPNLIQRKAISGPCPGTGYEKAHCSPLPKHSDSRGPGTRRVRASENCLGVYPSPENSSLTGPEAPGHAWPPGPNRPLMTFREGKEPRQASLAHVGAGGCAPGKAGGRPGSTLTTPSPRLCWLCPPVCLGDGGELP